MASSFIKRADVVVAAGMLRQIIYCFLAASCATVVQRDFAMFNLALRRFDVRLYFANAGFHSELFSQAFIFAHNFFFGQLFNAANWSARSAFLPLVQSRIPKKTAACCLIKSARTSNLRIAKDEGRKCVSRRLRRKTALQICSLVFANLNLLLHPSRDGIFVFREFQIVSKM
jgi:hypothetical protein